MNLKRTKPQEHPFSVSHDVFFDDRLNSADLRLYLTLKSFEVNKEVSTLSLEELAKLTRCSAQTVKASVKVLNDTGYVSSTPGNGRGKKYVHKMLK